VVDKRQDYDYIVNLLKDKPDLVDIMLEDEKLFWRVQEDEDIFLKISLFCFLLSCCCRLKGTWREQAILWK